MLDVVFVLRNEFKALFLRIQVTALDFGSILIKSTIVVHTAYIYRSKQASFLQTGRCDFYGKLDNRIDKSFM